MKSNRDHPSVVRSARQTYIPFSYKIDALECQEYYLQAIKEEIAQSDCRNSYCSAPIDYDNDSLCEIPRDARENVSNCSDICSERQYYYMACSHLGQQYKSFIREFPEYQKETRNCLFDKRDFCFLKVNLTKAVIVECYSTSNVTKFSCSSRCRAAVFSYRANSSCCVDYYRNYSYVSGPSIEEIFSACKVVIPTACTSFSRPMGFVNCTCASGGNHVGILTTSVIFIGAVYSYFTSLWVSPEDI